MEQTKKAKKKKKKKKTFFRGFSLPHLLQYSMKMKFIA